MATPETDPVRVLQLQQRVLESRVGSAERAVARLWVLVVAALLVTGQLLTFLTYRDAGEDRSPSLLTFGLGALTYTDEDGHRDTFTVVLGVAFAGLALLTAIALASLVGVARRSTSAGPNLRAPVAALLVVGLVGAWLTVLLAVSRNTREHPAQLHAGLPVFTVGVLLYTWLVVGESGRELWVP